MSSDGDDHTDSYLIISNIYLTNTKSNILTINFLHDLLIELFDRHISIFDIVCILI